MSKTEEQKSAEYFMGQMDQKVLNLETSVKDNHNDLRSEIKDNNKEVMRKLEMIADDIKDNYTRKADFKRIEIKVNRVEAWGWGVFGLLLTFVILIVLKIPIDIL